MSKSYGRIRLRPATGLRRAPLARLGVAVATAVALGSVPSASAGPAGLAVTPATARAALAAHPLRSLDGGTLTLGELRGDVVVVNFWATWCKPCRKELPGLDKLQAELASRGGHVVAVSIDQDVRNVRRFVRAHSLTLPIVHDGPEGLAKALDLRYCPFTIILDRSGEVAFTASGGGDDALTAIAAAARQLIAKTPALSRAAEGETP